jgi:hypothetical protein
MEAIKEKDSVEDLTTAALEMFNELPQEEQARMKMYAGAVLESLGRRREAVAFYRDGSELHK